MGRRVTPPSLPPREQHPSRATTTVWWRTAGNAESMAPSSLQGRRGIPTSCPRECAAQRPTPPAWPARLIYYTFPGVYGQVGGANIVPPGLLAGVLGASGNQPGVIGWSRLSYGVQGASLSGPGVAGTSALRPGLVGSGPVGIRGTGVFTYPTGEFGGGSGVVGVARKPGPGVLFNTAGVLGTSDVVPGVIGTSHSAIGVYGFSTGNAGVVGESVNSFAGFFVGNVMVSGNLTVNGMVSPNPKLAVMPFPDGTH